MAIGVLSFGILRRTTSSLSKSSQSGERQRQIMRIWSTFVLSIWSREENLVLAASLP